MAASPGNPEEINEAGKSFYNKPGKKRAQQLLNNLPDEDSGRREAEKRILPEKAMAALPIKRTATNRQQPEGMETVNPENFRLNLPGMRHTPRFYICI